MTTPAAKTDQTAAQHQDEGAAVTTKLDENRLPLMDAIALTLVIAFAAMVIAGWFNPMLPWVK